MPTGPQKLILIRSGRYEYAEVDLAGALQIVGPNNTGKTTLINTLQFLYLDDRRHMDFGSYTAEQTREFYFPNQYSYILFECLGAMGQCVFGWRGASKTSGGEPERFFHAGPYDAGDFLDEQHRVREPRDVSARLALKQYRVVKSAQEQRELLLPAVGGESRGLGIVALREPDRYHQFRETLKNLLTLAAITQDQMRDRLLMLADIPPARAAFDARELFGEDYDRIRARREKLLNFKKHQAVVEQLVGRFSRRREVRGELVWRWTDLKAKSRNFEQEHQQSLARLRDEKAAAERRINELNAELSDRRADISAFSEEKGKLGQPLDELRKLDTEFASFTEELERAALANLKQAVRSLEDQLANAERESRDKARERVAFFSEQVRRKQQTIERFDHLVVTALRRSFTEAELRVLFHLLNRDLLELPVGPGGVETAQPEAAIARMRALLARVQDGMYRDEFLSVPLSQAGDPLAGLDNPETAREQLVEYEEALKRWKGILAAIEDRERLEKQLQDRREEQSASERRLFRHEEYLNAKANEPRLRAELKKVEEAVAAANERVVKLERDLRLAATSQAEAEQGIRRREDDFSRVIGEFDQCVFPEYAEKARVAEGIPDDFGAAIALFLRQQDQEQKLSAEVTELLRQTEQWFGDEFRAGDDDATVAALQAELEALPEKEEALSRDWNAHIHGLRATFDLVLKNLDHVRAAAANLNRAFTRVQVSNLKGVKVEVVEQSDLVAWIKRLATFEPGGLFDEDPQQESAVANFRRRIQDSPVIRFADLFTIGFTVTGPDDRRHTYHDFRQIESHGTTITIKVLFSLLLLRGQLRRDDCAVPFFLDEIQTLDPANRQAILRTARQLGFTAITAAPEAVSEVDSLYFLQPRDGRIVLRQKHRISVTRPLPVG